MVAPAEKLNHAIWQEAGKITTPVYPHRLPVSWHPCRVRHERRVSLFGCVQVSSGDVGAFGKQLAYSPDREQLVVIIGICDPGCAADAITDIAAEVAQLDRAWDAVRPDGCLRWAKTVDQVQDPRAREVKISPMLTSEVYAVNWKLRDPGPVVKRRTLPCPRILLEKALWGIKIPFGIPVEPDVNRTKAVVSGATSTSSVKRGREGRPAKARSVLVSSTTTRRPRLAASSRFWPLETTMHSPMPETSPWSRFVGCEGSRATLAPPAFRTPSIATMVRPHFSNSKGT
ncbi:hypothetical protein N8I77_012049 [Diaporthe amygdali]|uniref:Uncharacterized protein n=1 Tax=Phomopsis amygdali TaxID=1214568 RepID=A0AAD9S5E2_PHOAM|nr:hypothetical protein N8I77_012049 [Diaporthe amygdali]